MTNMKPDLVEVARLTPEASSLVEIGFGGYKTVFKAKIGGGDEAAKYVFIPNDPTDPSVFEENIRRIEREIKVLGSCRTPFLVKLGSIAPRQITIGGECYVVYSEELLPGVSLCDPIRAGQLPSLMELATVAKCVLAAIEELNANNIIHRDIKPGNGLAPV